MTYWPQSEALTICHIAKLGNSFCTAYIKSRRTIAFHSCISCRTLRTWASPDRDAPRTYTRTSHLWISIFFTTIWSHLFVSIFAWFFTYCPHQFREPMWIILFCFLLGYAVSYIHYPQISVHIPASKTIIFNVRVSDVYIYPDTMIP